jgi:hypothetical protein
MDHEVLEVLRELGCFSADAIDELPEADEGNEFDNLYIDIGGEG